jgi:16S rRNA C967 or C1407 C5-methylase (RsmB/RsmF family)/NOL1/NOP2/fmu family ribosome biogenesis protein
MFPEQFIKRIRQQFNDADELIDSLQKPFVTSIRKHPVKGKNSSINVDDKVEWCPDSYYLKERPVFTIDPLFHAGAYYVQESSSMFLWEVLDNLFNEKDIRVLDLCAAPGGKSTLISSWLSGNGLLVSNEVIKSRANILLENITKWGYANNWVTSVDAYVLGGLDEFFDCIVIDAPCSGEGLFRRDKAAINEWSESNCELCSGRQRKIVAEILPALSTNGYLIYSTCTFNPGENDENIKWLLKEFPLEVTELNIQHEAITQTDIGGFAFYPQHTRGEGFYCCILKKTAEVEPNTQVRRQKLKFENYIDKNFSANRFVNDPDKFSFLDLNSSIIGIPVNLVKEFELVSAVTRIMGGYLRIGEIKGKDLIPDHSLAMSLYLDQPFPIIELSVDEALQYLSRKDLKLASEFTGWCTVSFQNQPLGFIKKLSNRINNYYPVEWRIRMDV